MAATLARDIMTRNVVTATLDMPADEIARLLLEHRISALPVIDSGGAPVGIVSEGDLIGRNESSREARRDWWLTMLAEGEELNPDFVASIHAEPRRARDIMSSPVISVDETTNASEIARLLIQYGIKRVPVVREGRLVGIVSRANLLPVLASLAIGAPPPAKPGSGLPGFVSRAFIGLDEHFHASGEKSAATAPGAGHVAPIASGFTMADFRGLAGDFKHTREARESAAQREAAERRSNHVKALVAEHIDDGVWQNILQRAREAAEHGAKEFLLLSFPSGLCSDGGREINAPLPGWPKTLRGEAAEIYLRWERDLKPRGFHLAARVLDFPGGMPGDIGLFLVWGE
jgi:CBS domain-containing protein